MGPRPHGRSMTQSAGPPPFRSGRAFPRYALWQARLVGGFGLMVGGMLLFQTVGLLLIEGESAFRLQGEPVVATSAHPWPALLAGGIALAFSALFVTPALLMEVEASKGPPEWTVTERGLVRRRGDEVRTLPWSRFGRVWAGRASKDRGHVYLWRRGFGPGGISFLRAEEGRVWTFGRALCLADVERPEAVAAAIRARLPP